MKKPLDAVVVGSGPCGAVAARSLAARGWRVALVDRHAFPRQKVCGDALLPDAFEILRGQGLADAVVGAGHPSSVLSVFSPGGYEVRVSGEFLTVRREVLDVLLHRAAIQLGAEPIVAAVGSVSENPDGVCVELRSAPTLQARACILATGADTRLLRSLQPVIAPAPTAVASRCYVQSSRPLDRLVVTYDRGLGPAYAWIFPVGDGLFNVGVGSVYRSQRRFDHRSLFERFTTVFPEARALMATGQIVSPLRSAPLRCGLDQHALRPGRLCLGAGEAAGSTFPFTGEGIGKAMATGLLAADAVHAFLGGEGEGLDSYASAVLRLEPRYRAYSAAHRLLDYPRLMDLAAWRLQKSPWLAGRLTGVLQEEEDPRSLFSIAGLLGSFFR